MIIETERLIIRNFQLSDEKDLSEYMLQRVNAEFEAYPDFTVEKAKKEIAYRAESDEFFAIELKENHKVIGNIYLGKRDFNGRELGYVLNENFQGKGYGTEASKAVISYFFKEGVHQDLCRVCSAKHSIMKGYGENWYGKRSSFEEKYIFS